MTNNSSKSSVFISYSRRDKTFVQKLHHALNEGKRDIWVDWEDIAPTEDWREAIAQGIQSADNFLFIISPDSVKSIECNKEIDHAIKCNKRLVPILYREVEDNSVRPELAKHNYIFFQNEESFFENLEKLEQALDTDLAYIKEHTYLLSRAILWQQKQRDPSYLLQGTALKEAQEWITHSLNQTPRPTQLHNDYIITSIQKSKQFLRRIAIVVGALGLIAFASFLVALSERNQAKEAELKAKSEEVKALTGWAQARLLRHEQLDALINIIRAVDKLKDLPQSSSEETFSDFAQIPIHDQVEQTLRQVVYTLQELNHLQADQKTIYDVQFSPDHRWIASASADTKVNLWKNNQRQTSLLHQGVVWRIGFSPDSQMMVSASEDKTVKLWQLNPQGNWTLKQTLIHPVPVRSVTFTFTDQCSQTGQKIASAGTDGLIRIWNLEGKLQRTFQAHTGTINDLKISPNCQTLASASEDRTAKLWTLDGQKKATLLGHENQVWTINFSPDGQRIVTGSFDTTIKLWDQTGQLLKTLEGHANWVMSVIFSRNSQEIVSGGEDAMLKFWSREGDLFASLLSPHGDIGSINISADNQYLVFTGDSGKMSLWQQGGSVIEILRGHTSGVTGVHFSPDGQLMASVSNDQTVKLWQFDPQAKRMELQQTLEYRKGEPEGGLKNVNFTPDGQYLITTSYDNTLQSWNVKKALTHSSIQGEIIAKNNTVVNRFRISSDGKRLALASADGTIKLWDLKSQKLLKILTTNQSPSLTNNGINQCQKIQQGYPPQSTDVAFSKNNQYLVASYSDGCLKLWNLEGQLIQEFRGHPQWINALRFSPDGQLLATTSRDNTIKLWQWEKTQFKIDQPTKILKGHQDWVWNVAFTSDGKKLASGGKDNTVKLWNITTQSPSDQSDLIVTLQSHIDWVTSVDFSPCNQDNKDYPNCHQRLQLASASADQTIIFWKMEEVLRIETKDNHETALQSLFKKGCQWLSVYLETNPDTPEASDIRSACGETKPPSDQPGNKILSPDQ
ncbi:WD-40 repeat protein [Rippkaea orientalis PCC 8801]|uniref:WD-40 repeat protein n=1 Tax=Rippkaea orientalis (strain PCC 8801 / RF-1) TaxID=41431 RepID=B7K2J6_RIPO1|nr:TIR domain-containing protein [Rippkaea orientalis]ACK66389.1 WD-40 repeat protein [Rippkaea orientalis PCC 8801]